MKSIEFSQLFPEPDYNFFHIDADGNVLYGKDVNGELDDVGEPAFWQNKNAVKKLRMSASDYATYLKDPINFLKNYKRIHNLKLSKKELKSIWKPQEWAPTNNTVPEILIKLQDLDFWNFRIYVTENDYFLLSDNNPYDFNIDKIDFSDSKNEYCLALKAMYVLSYLGGISIQNLNSKNKLAKSLAYFYFYYHLKKFFNYRDFSGFNTEAVESVPYLNSLYYWHGHHVYYHPQIHYTEKELKKEKKEIIRNIKRDGKWEKWETRGGKRDISKDYLKLINTLGNGLSKTGQLLLQESNQAYVYCILGAQAKTRWKIIGDGANSLQTQNVFKKLINEVIATNDLSNLIKSMRIAIKATNVRLNFCISPGLELLPSDMVFIKDSPGYNNILLVSTSNQNFGVNSSVNSEPKKIKEKDKPQKSLQNKPQNKLQVAPQKSLQVAPEQTNTTEIIGASLILAILTRIAWVAL